MSMNFFQTNLFENLTRLTKDFPDTFYQQGFSSPDGTGLYTIFNYRLASFSDFQQPDAMNCRGTMFELYDSLQPMRLAALPMPKFFNMGEGGTLHLNPSDVVAIEVKADGSLMSTYLEGRRLKLKSKGSISSEQALAAMAWLETQPALHNFLMNLENLNYTVNLEWMAPEHRIVVPYREPHLTVLNARKKTDGTMLSRNLLEMALGVCHRGIPIGNQTLGVPFDNVNTVLIERWEDPRDIRTKLGNLKLAVGMEGYVLHFVNGECAKMKSDWYLSLHHAKDSVKTPRLLFEAVLDEGTDDLKGLFSYDPAVMADIESMEQKVKTLMTEVRTTVDTFWETNKSLTQKEYAILGQKTVNPLYFSLCMARYTGKPIDFKGYIKRKWDQLESRLV